MTLPMLRLVVMALALLVAGAANSNPPPPTPPESKQQEQGKAGEREQEASKDQRGTQNSPLIIEVLPAKNADDIAKQKRDHEDDKSFYDGLIAWATIALASITFFLALFTAKLWNATKTLAEDAKRTADRQARDMQTSLATAEKTIPSLPRKDLKKHASPHEHWGNGVSTLPPLSPGFHPFPHEFHNGFHNTFSP